MEKMLESLYPIPGFWIVGQNTPSRFLENLRQNKIQFHLLKNTDTGSLFLPDLILFAEDNPIAAVVTPVTGLAQIVNLSQKYNFKIIVEESDHVPENPMDSQWLNYADAVVNTCSID